MRATKLTVNAPVRLVLGAAVLVAGCTTMPGKRPTTLSGTEQSPPVTTAATGTTDITVRPSKCSGASVNCLTVNGHVWTQGVDGTAAHIHQGAPGQNGPVVVTLVKVTDGVWAVPGETLFTQDQYTAYWNGLMYVNVHSEANKGGELRAQLKPN